VSDDQFLLIEYQIVLMPKLVHTRSNEVKTLPEREIVHPHNQDHTEHHLDEDLATAVRERHILHWLDCMERAYAQEHGLPFQSFKSVVLIFKVIPIMYILNGTFNGLVV
jgi:hypothetical protein